MSKYQIFEPGKYLDWEKKIIEDRLAVVEKGPPKGRSGPEIVNEYELLKFNYNWDPWNPLFNSKEYAQEAGYPDVPAWPCFKRPRGPQHSLTVPPNMAEVWYPAHGPDDVELFAPIFPGDSLYSEIEKIMFEDITVPGSEIRMLRMGSIGNMYNQKGELVVRNTNWIRNGYKKIIDGSEPPSASDRQLPPIHYTTDEEWEYIKELWSKEYIRGKDTLYWEDVNVGDEPAWACSGPISYMDMARNYGGQIPHARDAIMKGDTNSLFRDPLGQYLPGASYHYGNQNIPGSRMIFYNDTGTKHITRMVTNYMGDSGFVTRVGWIFQNWRKEMEFVRPGGEYLDKVPYMKGKQSGFHGVEGDTVIAKGYVTDKYINNRGEHIIDLTCWGESLDRRIVEVVPVSAKLPSK